MELGNKLIAILTNNDDDIYCFRLEVIKSLMAQGYKILISCPYGPKFELMKDLEFVHDEPYIDRRGTNIKNDFKLYWHYRKLFNKYRPDIVLTYTAKPNVYGTLAAKKYGIPVINNLTGFGSVIKLSPFKKKIIMSLFKYAYNKSDCIMFQNETNMKLAFQLNMVKGEYRLLPGSGVNTARYPIQEYPEGGNGIDGEKVVFNYIGRILYDKGVEDYMEAASQIKSKYPNTEFNMIGFIEPTEMHYKDIMAKLQLDDIIIYRGSQQDVKPFIKRAHAIIHPSIYGEGMSNVLLENASSGRPIITTDNPGCRETVKKGISGFIYTGGNVKELVALIEKFLNMDNKDRESMGKYGREYVLENFSREKVIDIYSRKIRELLI